MEHRYTKRKPTDLHVVVSCPRVGLFRGRVLNLSLGGMSVQSDCVVIPMHAPVMVSFQPDLDDPQWCLQVQGMVIHQDGNAFGLMFDELDAVAIQALRVLLQDTTASLVVNS
jgi:hypothetical protein